MVARLHTSDIRNKIESNVRDLKFANADALETRQTDATSVPIATNRPFAQRAI
jgi:hypothetical protein